MTSSLENHTPAPKPAFHDTEAVARFRVAFTLEPLGEDVGQRGGQKCRLVDQEGKGAGRNQVKRRKLVDDEESV